MLLAGIDGRVPGYTVNRFCGASLQTLRMAVHAIVAGEGEQYIAAGVESLSLAAACVTGGMGQAILVERI